MADPTKTTRRDFLTGQAAVEALADTVISGPEKVAPPEPLQQRGGYLLNVARQAMACEFEVLFRADSADSSTAEAAIEALDRVDSLEAQLTAYRPTSELMRLNAKAVDEPVVVERNLFDLIDRALRLSAETGGAFDITSGPLSKVWGFYRRQGSMPEQAEIERAMACVGASHVSLDRVAQTVQFARAGVELNLGAIGKGYAIDRAASVLRLAGTADFVIHGGNSSVLASGHRRRQERPEEPPAEAGWSIGLKHPLKPDERLAEFRLVNQALGTSGSGTQFFHHQGKRYGHVLDPRTGWPADRVLSATAIAPTAELADALSTALYVLGLDAGREWLATRPQIGALFVTPGRQAGAIDLHPVNLAENAWRPLV